MSGGASDVTGVTGATGATEVTESVEVSASPSAVWALVSDVTRIGELSPEATGARWLGRTGPRVGARFIGFNRNGWRRWPTSNTLTAWDPEREIAWRTGIGPVPAALWGFRIVPTATGCTVTQAWQDLRSRVVTVGTAPITGVSDREGHNRAGMKATLGRLKAVVERT